VTPEPTGPAAVAPDRAALRDALAYLRDEVEMLRVPLARLPEVLQTTRPHADALSLRQTYALIAARDEARRQVLRGEALGAEPSIPDDADALDADALLTRVADARTRLLDALDALPDAAFARHAPALHAAVLEDAALLRTVAEHLHDARGLAGSP
jgi:hypothetical protein